LVDVPEMKYFHTDKPCPRGEVCVRGPTVFVEYYKDPEKTAESKDSDGWFHTGDIGSMNDGGYLMIVDRKKNIFKLSQGEYIAPEKLENIYQRIPEIAQIYIYGNSLESCLIAVIVPELEVVEEWLKKEHPEMRSFAFEKICQSPELKSHILDLLKQHALSSNLLGYVPFLCYN
jgi:long-chain acyl-CoA synthetase